MGVTVRFATIDDAEAMAVAHVNAWKLAYRGIIADAFLDGMDLESRIERWQQNLSELTLAGGIPSPVNYVAELDGQVCGFACAGVWRESPEDTSVGELWALYADPDRWGMGVGHALMNTSVAQFDSAGIATAYLWVLEENRLARRFYERQGWCADDVTKRETIGSTPVVERRYSIVR